MLNSLSFPQYKVSFSTNPSQFNSHELVIFDSGVENIQKLIEGIKPGVDWVVFNAQQDGVEQITRILANHPGIKTLHIISHGAPGCLFLGNTQLSLETLEGYGTQLQSWFAASPPSPQCWGSQDSKFAIVQSPQSWGFRVGDLGAEDLGRKEPSILLYGCKVAAGDAGEEFINKLHQITQANIAASRTLTGNAQQGGNWEFDFIIGSIEPELALNAETQATYAGVLGVKLVKDISPGSYSSSPDYFTVWGDKLFFQANDGTHGQELWVSDGTEAGTHIVKDINPGSDYSEAYGFTALGDKLFFRANDGTHGTELWISDGTPGGTQLVKDINRVVGYSDHSLTALGDKLFFQANDGTHGQELWVSDGTEAGTHIVKDIVSGENSSAPMNFIVFGDKLFFYIYTSDEMWVSDGTETGTQLFKDIGLGSDFAVLGDKLFFRADDGPTGDELWVSDGTEAGTQLVKDINPGSDGGYPLDLIVLGDKLFFGAKDGTHGWGLWVSDGTEAGTQLVKDIDPGSDGLYPEDLTVLGDKLFFRADDGTHGWELWVSDGTEAGTHLVKDINPGSDNGSPKDLSVLGDKLFFRADDGAHGDELWVSDGTEAGTQLFKDIEPGSDGGSPVDLIVWGDKLFFTAKDGSNGLELWMYVNEAPTDVSLDNDNVDENVTTGTVVGSLLTTDPDSLDTHTYTLLDDAGGRFTLSDDQILVDDGTLLDRESADSHSIRVQTTDPEGLSYEKEIVIDVNNVNEAPEIEAQSFSIAEDVSDGATVGTVTADDVDGPTLTYSITAGNDDGIFTIDGIIGEITVVDRSQIDFETIESYDLTVEVSDSELQTSATVTVSITDVNDAPEIEEQSFEVAEDITNGSSVGTVAAVDADGDSLTYEITVGNDDGIFAIDENTGEITVADSSQIDFETTESYDLTVAVNDNETGESATVTVNITNVNEAPEFTSTAPTNSTQGFAYTYNIVVDDPDAGENLKITAPTLPNWLTFTDHGDGTATLNGTSGNTDVGFDAVELQVKDAAGEVDTQRYTLKVKNTNDAPTLVGTPETTVNEDESYSFVPSAEDVDGDKLSFSIQNKPDWATFNSATGALSGTPENEDVGTTENIVISVTDGSETVALDGFSLEVVNTNDAPEVDPQSFSVAEDASNGATVGTVAATDADEDSLTYSITAGNNAGIFAIDENTGEITIADSSQLNFEATASYNLTVAVSDSETGDSATVTVKITNVNEAPTSISLSNASIAENSPRNTVVGTLSTADPDQSDLHTYTLVDNAENRFKLSGKTILVDRGNLLDYEDKSSLDHYDDTKNLSEELRQDISPRHTIRVKTTDKQGLSYEQDIIINVEDGIIKSESELEKYLSDRRVSGIPGVLVESMFDVFELGENDPNNTATATIEFGQQSTIGGDEQLQLSLTGLHSYPYSFTPILAALGKVPGGLGYFSDIASFLNDLDLSIDLTHPTFTITDLDHAPVYEISAEVEVPEGDHFLGFIKDTLRVDVFTLKAGFNSDNNKPYIVADLDIDDITLFEAGEFSVELSHANLYMETGVNVQRNGSKLNFKAEPSVSLTPTFTIANYDPTQDNEPKLDAQGLFTFEPESITAGLRLKPEETWKNPFSIPDTEIRDLSLELGATYAGTGFDNVNIIGDLKFGDFDIASAFAVDVNDPEKNAILLTANEPIDLLELWMGPVTSYTLETIGDAFEPVQDALDLLHDIVDIQIESIDSDRDGDLDPLIKVVPESKSIGGQTVQTGLAINGRLTAWGAEATLEVEGNPYNLDNTFSAELRIPEIDLGFGKLSGTRNSDLSLEIVANIDEQYLKGNASLELFGYSVAKADVEITPSRFTLNEFDLDLGLVGFDVDDLSINWDDKTAEGRGEVTVLGQEVTVLGQSAVLLDFVADSNSITIKDFDVNLGLIALDVDDLSVNWRNNTASGQGELEIFGETSADTAFEITTNQIKVEDFSIGFKNILEIQTDNLTLNWNNWSGSGSGKIKLFGQELANASFEWNNGNLNVSGGLGISVLGYNLGLDVDVTLGTSSQEIEITFDFLGSEYTLLSFDLDYFVNRFTTTGSLVSVAEDLIWGAIGDVAGYVKDLLEDGINSITNVGRMVVDTVSDLISDPVQTISGWIDDWFGNSEDPVNYYGNSNNNEKKGNYSTADILFGNGGHDWLHGSGKNDLIDGGSGNDKLLGGNNNDTINGGDGDDTIFGQRHNDIIYGWAGDDHLQGAGDNNQYKKNDNGGDNDTIYGGLGNDNIWGEFKNDYLYGNAGNDYISGGDGHDYINAGVGNDKIDGGYGIDTVSFEGDESDYTQTKLSNGWKITSKSGDVTRVFNVEYFKFASTRRYVNSNIENAEVFFDANLNGVRDPNEPFAMTEADGSFDLQINLEQYDLNYNGVLDPTEGLIIGQGGTYVSSGLPVETSMSAIPGSEMVTPLTTLVVELVMQGIEPEAAEAQVKLALGLPEDIDLGTFNYLDAAADGNPNGLKVYSAVVQVQNTIVTATKLIEGVAADASAQIANATIEAIAAQIQNSQSLDLSQPETLDAILNSTISTVSQLDTEIDTTQLSQVSAIAVQVMAQSNQLIQETANSEGALNELATNITRIQKVALGDVAESLSQLAAGTKTVEEFAAEVTPEAIEAKLAETVVSDPTFRPEVVDDASEENIISEESIIADAEGSTDNTSGSNNTGSSNEQFIGSVVGSGSGSASETNNSEVNNSIPQIISPVQPTMAEMTTSVTEATVESDMMTGNDVEPMYLLDGHDTLMANDDDNWVNGNVGNDMIDVSAGNDTVFGGQDNDTVFGSAGNDWLSGNKGADFLDGGEDNDTLYGGEDSDTLQGNAGDDWLSGNKGADFLDGGDGMDILYGGQDEDTLQGGADNDELCGNVGADLMEGNEGNDLLYGGQDHDTVSGNNGDDIIYGDRGDDLLDGNAGNDLLNGGEGNDLLNGGEGDDQLFGDAGDDILFGAAGNDTLTGGEGSDRFILTPGSGSNLITDFTDGEDIIVLEDGLTFEQLTIETAQNATIVKFNEEILATLHGVESGLVAADDFNNI